MLIKNFLQLLSPVIPTDLGSWLVLVNTWLLLLFSYNQQVQISYITIIIVNTQKKKEYQLLFVQT